MPKKYRLYDLCEGYDFLGEFDTMLAVCRAALQFDADTNGECCLAVFQFFELLGRYEYLPHWGY